MRILFITSLLPYGRTSEAFLIPEIEAMRRQGHEVRIVPMLPRGPIVHEEARALLDLTEARPLFSAAMVPGALRAAFSHPGRTLATLALLARAGKGRLIAKNLAVFPKALWLADLARRWRADHLYVHWAATTASMTLAASEVSGVPFSFTAHRWDILENNLLDQKIERATMARFICRRGIELMELLDVKPSRQPAVVFMGVPVPEPASPPTPEVPVIMCPANFVAEKGHPYLIRAAAMLKARGLTFELRFAGIGEQFAPMRRLVSDLDLEDCVHFLGWMPHEALLADYTAGRVSVVAIPSLSSGLGLEEGIPVALIEAMSHGIPVVSTATGGIPELLAEGAGIMVPQQDVEALAEALAVLITDPDARARQGRAGRQRIEQAFAIDQVVSDIVARLQAS